MLTHFEAIPAELKSLAQWVCWRTEWRADKRTGELKPTKVPLNAHTDGHAATDTPATWTAFEAARRAAPQYDGIGFVFTATDPYFGIDLDGCRDPETGELADWAQRTIQNFNTYGEASPTGTGVHLIGRGVLQEGDWHKKPVPRAEAVHGKKPAVEVYDRCRFFTMTGHLIEGLPASINDGNVALRKLQQWLAPPQKSTPTNGKHPAMPPTLDDLTLIDKLSKDPKYAALWRGDFDSYPSQSEADLALCGRIAFFTGPNPDLVDRIFQQSGLMREKWDDPSHGRAGSTYGASTIAKAIEGRTEFYTPTNGARPKPATPPAPPGTRETHPDEQAAAGLATEEKRGPARAFDQLQQARAFAAAHTGHLLFVDGEQWWQYRANHWRYTGSTMARAAMQHFLMDQQAIPSTQIKAATVRGTLDLAGPLLGPLRVDDLNPHRDWIPLANGVYDTETGEFFNHDPRHHFSYCLPYRYDPRAECPRISAFFRQVLITEQGQTCPGWVAFMEEWFAYCLLANNRAQATLVNVGEGMNGKGVTTRLLQQFVGPSQQLAIDVEMLHEPYHRAALVGKLVGFINEPSRRALEKNGGVLKAISGGDEISARNPCERVFSFLPTTRLVVSCNTLPATKDLSRGYFRRLVLIEWRFRPQEPDTELDEKLVAELPGLFNLAMRGLQRFRQRGYKFAELPESDRLKADYQTSQDSTAQFVEDVCVRDAGLSCTPAEIYRAYSLWCRSMGYKAPLDRNAFGQRLTRPLGFPPSVQEKDTLGMNHRVRHGLALDRPALQTALGPKLWREFTDPHEGEERRWGGDT